MEKHILWSSELTKNKNSITWSPAADEDDEQDSDIAIQQTLQLSHACYGGTSDDAQVVSVKYKQNPLLTEDDEATTEAADEWKSGVLCVLKKGANANMVFNLKSDKMVQFELTSGSGPVYILGTHSMIAQMSVDSDEDGYENSFIDDEAEEVAHPTSSEEESDEEPSKRVKKESKSVSFSETKNVKPKGKEVKTGAAAADKKPVAVNENANKKQLQKEQPMKNKLNEKEKAKPSAPVGGKLSLEDDEDDDINEEASLMRLREGLLENE